MSTKTYIEGTLQMAELRLSSLRSRHASTRKSLDHSILSMDRSTANDNFYTADADNIANRARELGVIACEIDITRELIRTLTKLAEVAAVEGAA